ncbi:TPA: hypothetical protein I8P16_003625 [Salmonella enterica subsp. enterica serovar Napoli]|nr:hypothetical protein [Salmonella enterica subsp. enterica serovar Napoli]HBC0245141.1 hypothetical protein [Salmonella enterica subsp. enterica serovar Napoli]HBC0305380.1 hypothetical protein [Salmonella enterica subsp. enterica serovar Napoli]HBC0317923.1 hypothetical protein [Salmonella enterica subsp. enterica serovar Napoli]
MLPPVSGKLVYRQALLVIGQWGKPSHTEGAQKAHRLFNNLLNFFIAGTKHTNPRVVTVLNGIPATLFIPSGNHLSEQQCSFKNSKAGS